MTATTENGGPYVVMLCEKATGIMLRVNDLKYASSASEEPNRFPVTSVEAAVTLASLVVADIEGSEASVFDSSERGIWRVVDFPEVEFAGIHLLDDHLAELNPLAAHPIRRLRIGLISHLRPLLMQGSRTVEVTLSDVEKLEGNRDFNFVIKVRFQAKAMSLFHEPREIVGLFVWGIVGSLDNQRTVMTIQEQSSLAASDDDQFIENSLASVDRIGCESRADFGLNFTSFFKTNRPQTRWQWIMFFLGFYVPESENADS